MENDLELQRVNQVCLPCWDARIKSVVLRPERPEYAIRMGVPLNKNWIRVLERLEQVKICAYGCKTLSHTHTEHLRLCHFLDRTGIFCLDTAFLTGALQFATAILYDQECSRSVRDLEEACPGNAEKAEERCSVIEFCSSRISNMHDIIIPMFEHMLLIDYGIEQADDSKLDVGFICDKWPLGRCEFDNICDAVVEWAQRFPVKYCFEAALCVDSLNPFIRGTRFDYSDLALMIYYYNTHRKPVSVAEYKSGKTGYFGILQELVSEVPLRGSDRLQRKLSVDINELIPKTVKDPDKRQRMISIARNIAAQHGIPLEGSVVKIPKPLFETKYWRGHRSKRWGVFKAPFTSLPFFKSKKQDKNQKLSMNDEELRPYSKVTKLC